MRKFQLIQMWLVKNWHIAFFFVPIIACRLLPCRAVQGQETALPPSSAAQAWLPSACLLWCSVQFCVPEAQAPDMCSAQVIAHQEMVGSNCVRRRLFITIPSFLVAPCLLLSAGQLKRPVRCFKGYSRNLKVWPPCRLGTSLLLVCFL